MIRIVRLVFLVVSVILAATFIASTYFDVKIPYASGIERKVEDGLLVAYALLLFTVLVASRGENGVGGWPQTFGSLAAIVGAVVAAIAFWQGYQKSLDVTALQLFVELDKSRPPNTRACRCTIARLDVAGLGKVLRRETVALGESGVTTTSSLPSSLTSAQASPSTSTTAQLTAKTTVSELARRCFSDKSDAEFNELIKEDALTPRGAAALAERGTRILQADEDYALAIQYRIGRPEMIAGELSFNVDKVISNSVYALRSGHDFPAIDSMAGEASTDRCDVP
jgi:hypothetical protein